MNSKYVRLYEKTDTIARGNCQKKMIKMQQQKETRQSEV